MVYDGIMFNRSLGLMERLSQIVEKINLSERSV